MGRNKATCHIKKHAIDFVDIPDVFNWPMLVRLDSRSDYGEDRFIGIGLLQGLTVVVVYVECDKTKKIRIISARKATRHEKQYFEKYIADRLK